MHTVQCGISLAPNIAGMSKLRALARLACARLSGRSKQRRQPHWVTKFLSQSYQTPMYFGTSSVLMAV